MNVVRIVGGRIVATTATVRTGRRAIRRRGSVIARRDGRGISVYNNVERESMEGIVHWSASARMMQSVTGISYLICYGKDLFKDRLS